MSPCLFSIFSFEYKVGNFLFYFSNTQNGLLINYNIILYRALLVSVAAEASGLQNNTRHSILVCIIAALLDMIHCYCETGCTIVLWYVPCYVAQSLRLFATLWTVAHQASLSMGFSRQEYWSGLPCSPPGDLPDPGIKLASLMSPALPDRFFTTSTTWECFGMHGELILGHSTPHGYQTLLIQWHSIVIYPLHLHFCICRFNQWEPVSMKGRLYWH